MRWGEVRRSGESLLLIIFNILCGDVDGAPGDEGEQEGCVAYAGVVED